MSVSLLAPDLRRILADLARRIGILERRVIPTPTTAHSHDGSGADSVLVADSNSDTVASGDNTVAVGGVATASSDRATAVGYHSNADDPDATAVGSYAQATGDGSTALGATAVASGADAVAVGTGSAAAGSGSVCLGHNTTASHSGATAVGQGATTTNSVQTQVGAGGTRVIQAVSNTAVSDSDLRNGQLCFYLNEGSGLLTAKVKYSDGTIKTGTVALT